MSLHSYSLTTNLFNDKLRINFWHFATSFEGKVGHCMPAGAHCFKSYWSNGLNNNCHCNMLPSMCNPIMLSSPIIICLFWNKQWGLFEAGACRLSALCSLGFLFNRYQTVTYQLDWRTTIRKIPDHHRAATAGDVSPDTSFTLEVCIYQFSSYLLC